MLGTSYAIMKWKEITVFICAKRFKDKYFNIAGRKALS